MLNIRKLIHTYWVSLLSVAFILVILYFIQINEGYSNRYDNRPVPEVYNGPPPEGWGKDWVKKHTVRESKDMKNANKKPRGRSYSDYYRKLNKQMKQYDD